MLFILIIMLWVVV